MQTQGHTFLVTGGSSGLGEATVRRLHASGGSVVIADLDAPPGKALAAELGNRVRFAETDVTDEASVSRAVDMAVGEFGSLHGLVNCAGIAPAARVLGKTGPMPLEQFQRVVEINLIGTFNCIRLAAVPMSINHPHAGGERGVIVNTASVAATEGQIGQAAYAASKAGVAGLTLPLARELARFGIRVMTIAPGIFDTPMMAGMSDEVRESLAKQVPFPARFGHPAEYAALVEHIVANPMLNGEVIRLDGALRMGPQ